MKTQSKGCRVFWGTHGCSLPRGHKEPNHPCCDNELMPSGFVRYIHYDDNKTWPTYPFGEDWPGATDEQALEKARKERYDN